MDKDIKSLSENNSIIPEDKRLFFPNWDNRPPKQKTIITGQGSNLLKTGGQLCITAKAGVGKSSICEAIISNHLNSDSDGLGFNVSLSNDRNKILYIDTERSNLETWDSWERTLKRSNINYPKNTEKVIFGNFKSIPLKDRMNYVEQILHQNNDIGLIIFDGSSDFINNTNDIIESNQFIDWINTFNPLISLIFTIHTNPKDDKPRGHLGSELCRRANSVLLAQKIENDIVRITSEFSDGKVRHGSNVNWFYSFNAEMGMFVSVEHNYKRKNNNKEKEYVELSKEIWGDNTIMYYSDIVKGIELKTGKSYENSKQIFNRKFKDKICRLMEISTGKGWVLI